MIKAPIQSLWIGPSLSLMEQMSIRSFLQNGHHYHLYVYNRPENIPAGVELRNAAEILPESDVFTCVSKKGLPGSVAVFSDRFRYKLLYEKGGWWCDTDVICLRAFNFDREYVFCGQRRRGRFVKRVINNGVIKAPVGSGLMAACYRKAVAAGSDAKWGQTGPTLLSKMFIQYYVPRSMACFRNPFLYVAPPKSFQPVDWWQVKMLIDPIIKLNLESSYAVHLWNENWRRSDMDKNGIYPPGCIFENLKRRFSP